MLWGNEKRKVKKVEKEVRISTFSKRDWGNR